MEDKNSKKYKILLTGFVDSDTGAEIPYLFHKAGCEVHVLSKRNYWLTKNSYVDEWVPGLWVNPEQFAAALQKLVSGEHYDWVVVIDDAALGILKEYITDEILAKKILPLSKTENRSCLWSKAALSVLCQNNNIVTPAFVVYDGGATPTVIAQKIGYPLVLKIDRSSGGGGVFFCGSEKQMLQHWQELSDQDKHGLVFQKYIKGDNIACEVLFKNGQLLAYAPSKVIATIEGEFGASMVRIYSARTELEPVLGGLGQALGINGFGNLTFIYSHQDNRYYLLEADLRPQAWFRLAELVGLDFSMAIKNYLSGNCEILRPILKDQKIMRNFSREIGFYLNARRRNFMEILKWAVNTEGRWQFIPWYDKRLLAYTLLHLGIFWFTESKVWLWVQKTRKLIA